MKHDTVKQTSDAIRNRLREYIEARYNIKDKYLVRQRRELLDAPGNIYQIPYLESTKKYQTGKRFKEIQGVSDAFLDCVKILSNKQIFDPPYSHQLEAVESVLVKEKSIVVMSGTGSGKTECFLWPILGKISEEAKKRPESYKKHRAMRALILYPMNALVNDQLGRLRQLFGSEELKGLYREWTESDRILTFAKYTGRSPYPGKRNSKRSALNLRMFEDLIDIKANQPQLYQDLKKLGKWPAKPDLEDWYGSGRWNQRCFQLPNDSELLIRQEVQEDPPDILITNYSMLSYMLMRPIERVIFERTSAWLQENPDEKFILCLDEAHLYRGSGGTEVSFLLKRFIERLNIDVSRIQVIASSASFGSVIGAQEFISKLTGAQSESIEVIEGLLIRNDHTDIASERDVIELLKVDLDKFYQSDILAKKEAVEPFLRYREISIEDITGESSELEIYKKLYQALKDFKPLGLLLNETMEKAEDIEALGKLIFPDASSDDGEAALTVLIALSTNAKEKQNESGLLSSRVHLFLRGLPGLWLCLNKNCSEKNAENAESPFGKLYSQPRDRCKCGTKVYEFLTCRFCGTNAIKVYTEETKPLDESEQLIWSEGGERLIADGEIIQPLTETHLLLEDVGIEQDLVRPSKIHIRSGILRPQQFDDDVVNVWVSSNDEKEILECPKCNNTSIFKSSPIQDHQTKGVEPIKAVISKQIEIQPLRVKPTKDKPMGGRKVLAFSDSRKNASTLVTTINEYSLNDTIRPLLSLGLKHIQSHYPRASLDNMYTALLIGSALTNIRLRTTDKAVNETMISHENDFFDSIENEESITADLVNHLLIDSPAIPDLIGYKILQSVFNKRFGLQALAVASIKESKKVDLELNNLPSIEQYAESDEQKKALIRLWLYYTNNDNRRKYKPWMQRLNSTLWLNPDKQIELDGRKQTTLISSMGRFLGDKKTIFKRDWLHILNAKFSEIMGNNKVRIRAQTLDFDFSREQWVICDDCRGVQTIYPENTRCIHCYSSNNLQTINPDEDEVFSARVSYDRNPIINTMNANFENLGTINLITKEHTAQLNSSTDKSIFNENERNELNFQDIKVTPQDTNVDILSSTTTMEVGIDIGSLTGVTLRGIPPARSNYQQRAGRAGRRGNSIASVIAYGHSDTHDEHFFSNPATMIKGEVEEPKLNLNNVPISFRHINAFLLEKYQLEYIQLSDEFDERNLYSSLGSTRDFYYGSETDVPSFSHFKNWVSENSEELLAQLNTWLPEELSDGVSDFEGHVAAIKKIGNQFSIESDNQEHDNTEIETIETDFNDEEGFNRSTRNTDLLLDALMEQGILPKYGFPTDLISFHVFKKDQTYGRVNFEYDPTYAISVALSAYAPGKNIPIGGNLYTSSAVYSRFKEDRYDMWKNKNIYSECNTCNYIEYKRGAREKNSAEKPCPICNQGKLGPERWSIRPVGFAHPHHDEGRTGEIDMLSFTSTTSARFRAPNPVDDHEGWQLCSENIRVIEQRSNNEHPILITNNGPGNKGYDYCATCGVIEPNQLPRTKKKLVKDEPHRKPYPVNDENMNCDNDIFSRGIVLGCQVLTDLLLISFRFNEEDSCTLFPEETLTRTVFTTLCEALSIAAARKLEVESRDIAAGYRFSHSGLSIQGKEMEIFLYDTLSGGAGYSSSLYDSVNELFDETLNLLTNCPEDCDSSCYKCLRSFSNKYKHNTLERHLTASFLNYALHNEYSELDKDRASLPMNSLYVDLKRKSDLTEIKQDVKIYNSILEKEIVVPILIKLRDEEYYICLENPLNKEIYNEDLKDLEDSANVYKVNEFIIKNNIASVTRNILSRIPG